MLPKNSVASTLVDRSPLSAMDIADGGVTPAKNGGRPSGAALEGHKARNKHGRNNANLREKAACQDDAGQISDLVAGRVTRQAQHPYQAYNQQCQER